MTPDSFKTWQPGMHHSLRLKERPREWNSQIVVTPGRSYTAWLDSNSKDAIWFKDDSGANWRMDFARPSQFRCWSNEPEEAMKFVAALEAFNASQCR